MLLQSIRDKATGWIAWVIVILISIPFALWGIQEYLSPGGSATIAKINGTEVSVNEFHRLYQRQRMQLQAMLGPRFDPRQIDEERLRERALNDLVDGEVVLQAAIASGMRVGDAQLAQAIQSLEAFQQDGRFSQELYEQWLSRQGYSPEGFEYDLRRSILTEQLVSGVASSAFVTAHELDDLMRMRAQTRRFAALTVPVSRFADATVNDAAVEAYYQANMDQFVAPEEVRVEYVELAREEIAKDIGIDEEELRQRYETRKESFGTPEQREAAHILIRLPLDADEAAVKAATDELLELARQLEAGADFAELAKQHSQDPGSASQGGSLGAFGKGVMDPDFEAAAFALGVGEVSEPVRSSFGLHLIKVTGIEEARTRTFEEVRAQLERELRRERSESIFVDRLEQLANLAFEQPKSLDAAADTLGLEKRTLEWFTPLPRLNQGLAANPDVVEAAFSADVMELGNNSEVIEVGTGRVMVLRVADHRPARQQSLEEVSARIRERLVAEKAREQAAEQGRALLARLAGGAPADEVAREAELEWSEPVQATRDAADRDAAVLETAFHMPRPAAGETVYDGVATGAGDFVIVALEQVVDGDPQAAPKDERDAAAESLALSQGRNDYQSVVRELRDEAKVEIYRDNL
ncbi:MAG: SurA N-terminal domain-containing protein [Gammaproteobacteria bacterium]|nr:SurA N-terminal domain-containing protein [Gammaproteobacteria bacterium]